MFGRRRRVVRRLRPAAVDADTGDVVLALWPDDGRYYRATVGKVADDGALELFFEDGDYRAGASPLDVRRLVAEAVGAEDAAEEAVPEAAPPVAASTGTFARVEMCL